MTIIADIETNGITPDKIWCLCTYEVEKDKKSLWTDYHPRDYPIKGVRGTLQEGMNLLKASDRVVGHNFVGYDAFWMNKLHGLVLHPDQIIDTLLLSRLLFRKPKGHSLAEWGERLGISKGDFSDFDNISQDMVDYCMQDVMVNKAVYDRLMASADETTESVLKLEQRVNFITTEMTQGGVRVDVGFAQKKYMGFLAEKSKLEREFQKLFPPVKETRYSTKTGKQLKDKIHEFNPNSNDMVAEVLVKHCGYKSKRRTDTGKLLMDEIALSSVDHEYAKMFLRHRKLKKLCNTFYSDRESGWLDLMDENNRVHHRVNTLGAATGRCSQSRPNVTLVDKADPEMRQWIVPDEGDVMVGCDASELELRVLSHFLFGRDGGSFKDKLLNGDKEKGTDAHTVNAKAFGVSRDHAKNLVYGYLYGAGDGKLMSMLKEYGSPIKSPSEIKETMNKAVKGLVDLINKVTMTFHKRGFVRTPTGFIIPKPSKPNASLNYLIQGTGASIIKQAMSTFHFEKCIENGLVDKETLRPIGWRYLLQPHDEIQMTAQPDIAEKLGQTFVDAIEATTDQLNLNCPMTGEYQIGNNWHETH